MNSKMSDQPLVSVLTPSFNQGSWLQDNLTSVQRQTYQNIEQIVMDGGSTDETLQVLENAPSYVKWTSEPDRGQSHALNKALGQSSGEIIGWINSDDAYVDRRAVATAVETFRRHPDVGVVYGHGLVLNESNEFMLGLWSPPYIDRALELGMLFLQPSLFFRRDVLPEPFVREDMHYVMDWEMFLRLREKGVRFKRIPVVVGLDRQQPDRKTLSFDKLDREVAQTFAANGVDYNLRVKIERKAITSTRRLIGVQMAARIPQLIDPAIEIDFLTARRRILNQGLLPRRFIR